MYLEIKQATHTLWRDSPPIPSLAKDQTTTTKLSKETLDHRFLTRWQAHLRSRVSIHKCVHFHPLSPTNRLIRWKPPGALRYLYGGVLGAEVNYNGTGDDFSCYQPSTGFPQMRSPMEGGSHLDDRYSSTEQNHNPSLYGGEQAGFPGSEAASLDYLNTIRTRADFGGSSVGPFSSDGIDVLGRADPALSHPAGMVGNQVATQLPAESPPLGANNFVIRQSSRRKGSTSPDGRRGRRGTQRKNRQRLTVQEQSQVSPAGIGPTRKRVVITVVLAGSRRYLSVHAPRGLPGGTGHVPIRKRAERLA